VLDRGTADVLGFPVAAIDYEAAVERIVAAARGRQPMAVSALAVHGLMTGALDPVHRYRLNHFDLLVPDGQPVRWALRWLHGISLPDRVYGPELMRRLCRRAAVEGLPIFLFGGTREQLSALESSLRRRYPALIVAGVRSSQFRRVSADEQAAVARAITESGAAITFVGLGCPRQEVWAFEQRARLAMPVVAVGAAFAFLAGLQPVAPRAMQDAGLEWLHRLLLEPRRLWRRYLLLNPAYLGLIALQATGLHRCDPRTAQPPAGELRYG
jgi:exopolysaccharide biosynthesis WecB/TagA/CpsF family protein